MKTRAVLLCSLLSIALLSPGAFVIGQEDKKDAAKAEIERHQQIKGPGKDKTGAAFAL